MANENLKALKELNETKENSRQYKCPGCKNAISLTSADFIKGIAMASCSDCGRNAFAIEDLLLNRQNKTKMEN